MTENIKKVSANEFLSVLESADMPLVIDVRTGAEVGNEYLDGCVNIPLHELSLSQVQTCVVEKEAAGQPVYLLCGTGKRATSAIDKLKEEVVNPLLVIDGGIEALKQAGCSFSQGKGSVMPLERQVRIAAGSLVLVGVLLGTFLTPGFYGVSAFVGAGLVFAGITDTCAMGMLLARMPWNSAAR
jgi:rhodanese-related sulfurtransferase